MPRRVDAFAQLPHYADHLRPVWEALPDERRGTWWGAYGDGPMGSRDPHPDRPMLVASLLDQQRIPHRPVILVEHGAGQTYGGDPRGATHGSYSGGDGWDRALGFICPSETVAARWRDRYPQAEAVAVGCPKLDPWIGRRPVRSVLPCVVFVFHWDCPLVPETRSAADHYLPRLAPTLATLRALGYTVAAHNHPRWGARLRRQWHDLDVPVIDRLDDVFASAAVMVADNTSAMYEFAALDRPVVALNAPWYRRDVHHGLRFWSDVPGPQVDDVADLADVITTAHSDGHMIADVRRAVVARVYAHVDGGSAQRAASAVVRMLDR